jgi:hypothetical protein
MIIGYLNNYQLCKSLKIRSYEKNIFNANGSFVEQFFNSCPNHSGNEILVDFWKKWEQSPFIPIC